MRIPERAAAWSCRRFAGWILHKNCRAQGFLCAKPAAFLLWFALHFQLKCSFLGVPREAAGLGFALGAFGEAPAGRGPFLLVLPSASRDGFLHCHATSEPSKSGITA